MRIYKLKSRYIALAWAGGDDKYWFWEKDKVRALIALVAYPDAPYGTQYSLILGRFKLIWGKRE